jgi:hypothetical protein
MGRTACVRRTVPVPHLGPKFEAEFRLRFVKENEQDQALTKLESHSYFQGSRDIYQYTDDFEELAITAGYSDTLVRVTKYRSGLDPQINVVITTSGTVPDLTDYDGWRLRAFQQYEVFGRARTGNLRRGFRQLSHGRAQWAYFRLRLRLQFPCALRSHSPRLRHLSFQQLSQ